VKTQWIVALPLLLAATCLLGAAPGTPGGLPPGEKRCKSSARKITSSRRMDRHRRPRSQDAFEVVHRLPGAADKAPVVIVIHEIFGESDWIRSVADQLAADGFIAIAPDMLSGHGKDGGGTDSLGGRDEVTKAIRGLKQPEVIDDVNAVRDYGLKLPAASGKTATIGFCWGGGQSFAYAAGAAEARRRRRLLWHPAFAGRDGEDHRAGSGSLMAAATPA